jgi:CheY-like chemotaxis protein
MLGSSPAAREVVVVDDDVDAREALAELLESRGYSVTSTSKSHGRLGFWQPRPCVR